MTEQYVLAFVLVLSRVSIFIAFLPLFGNRQVPALVKAGLATALTLFWADAALASASTLDPTNTLLALLLIAKEAGIGFFLALLIGFFLVPAKIAGAYIGQEIGLSLAAISNPDVTDQSTLITVILEALSVFLFFALKAHHFLILCLHHSFGHFQDRIDLLKLPTAGLIEMINQLPQYGLAIVAPIGICMFLLVVGLSFLNKAAPTLNLFSIGMPIRSGLGILCLLFFMPMIVHSISDYMTRMQLEVESMLGAF